MHIKRAMSLAFAAATIVAAVVPAQAQSDTFRRHFYRGQAYHGTGYPAQIGEASPRQTTTRPDPLQATVEEGSRGASIARCAARFKSFDPSTNTYRGADGRRRRC